ncbi:RluA family pseudouridine synthase [Paenibacillus alginolyticus]|uniref:Pseudouridine synthase n=1 Tax=Paenibacillus alginolyticus TaxID=59839 RepID=A0ABT4GDM6_9BACL|nr:RluA family pseudouridine synthase [Paenibacillus alginolyticus]MCY9663778.1 RluA family pseudouridine synthase [Paenibacillus alginolyticus]MCY9694289.1 RluA family pseudouridine synthase [Paenibacillus alginolyticus]MEC0142839.1 RluA family pseudouridine synthase [Paenibacillus alginolyticus]
MTEWKRSGEWLEIPLPNSLWKPLKPGAIEELAAILPVPRKYFLRLASQGLIRIQDDKIRLHAFPEEKAAFRPEPFDLAILYEDDFCLVVNKPAGMSVHPAEAGQSGTLASAVAYYFESTGQACGIRHIHRLDQDTTGAVLYAKNEWAHVLLDEAMRDKRIDRRYVALAEGVFRLKQGSIDEPIGKDRYISGKRRVSPSGDQAVTHYRVLEQMKKAAFVELELETGRTHQIRVHLSHIGHPLAGDSLYGGSSRLFHRQALHGERLSFDHPVTQKQVIVHAPLPQDFKLLLEEVSAL